MEQRTWRQQLQALRSGPLVMVLVLFGLVLLGLQVFRGTLTQRLPTRKTAAPVMTRDVETFQRLSEPSPANALVPSVGGEKSMEPPMAPPAGARQIYDAAQSRDPFVGPWHRKAWADAEAQQQRVVEPPKPHAPPPSLAVQGTIFGGAKPFAIINNETVSEGDMIEGAVITRIEPDGIVVMFDGQELHYTAGQPPQHQLRRGQGTPWQSAPPAGNYAPHF